MIPRIVDVAQENKFISKSLGFLRISDKNGKDEVAIDDIAVLMLSEYGATVTKEALVTLAEKGAITVLCGAKCTPIAYVTPMYSNYLMAERAKYQVSASKPLNKRIWQRIVEEKLNNQAAVLEYIHASKSALKIREYMKSIQSGDVSNREASAARIYWPSLLGKGFRRKPEGDWPNPLFNYGYAVLRAASLRSLCAVGLLPSFGIHHADPQNPNALADDLMEVYRPLVDMYALRVLGRGLTEMNRLAKEGITSFIWADLSYGGVTTPFHQALETFAYSLVKSYETKKECLEIPRFVLSPNMND